MNIPTRIKDYWTGREVTGPEAERKLANIARIAAEPQDTEAQTNAVWFRINTIAGNLRPLRG